MTPFTTVALSAAIMTVTNAKTLIIGGGPSGVHMGYRLQELDQPSVIWEMTDQLGGKTGNQYEKNGTTMNIGVNFMPSAYRETMKLIDELGMKNSDEMKKWTSPQVVDPVVGCLLAMGLDESKCQDLTVYSKEMQAKFVTPNVMVPTTALVRGLLLMKEEGYFDTFVNETTEEGFDWTSQNLDFGGLVPHFFKRLFGYEMTTYGQYFDKYTDDAFSNPTNMDIDFNKYSLFKKSDEAKEALNQKVLHFMQEKKLFFFRLFAEIFVTGLGYGNFDDTPLYYLGMMLNPQYLAYLKPGGSEGLFILKRGFPSVLDNMVTQGNLDVRLNREVTKVVHVQEEDSSFFEVYYEEHDLKSSKGEKKTKRDKGKKNAKDSESIKKEKKSGKKATLKKSGKKATLKKSGKKGPLKMERFDQVISGMSSQNFVSIYNKGKEIEQPFLCREACTWVSTVAEVASSTTMSVAFDGTVPVFEQGFNYLEDPSVANTLVIDPLRLKGIPLGNDGSRRMQMYYRFPYKSVSKSQAQALNKEDFDTLFDARYADSLDVKEVYSTVVVENYSATSKDLSTCDPWDVHEMQGKNGLYFIGGTVNFENLELLLRYNNYILDTHFQQ